MKLLALMHSPPGSGGDTTIRRIAAHLVDGGHSVLLVPDPGDARLLAQIADRHGVDAMIGTHALIAGQQFLGSPLPYVIVFGGTDLNEYVHDPQALAVMTRAVEEAAALVAFTEDFVHRCRALWPQVVAKLDYIPQGVHTQPARFFSLKHSLGLADDDQVLLLPSGLRPVKDPLLLMHTVRQWHEEDPRIRLVITGLSYDPDFTDIVRRRCAASPGVDYIGPLSRADLHAAMRESTAVLNTSLSECSPNALLEAMRLRCAVLARDIPGNTCLVRDEVTGLVFTGPDDFRGQAQRLVDDGRLRHRLGRQAEAYVRLTHGPHRELRAYGRLFEELARRPVEVLAGPPPVMSAPPVGSARSTLDGAHGA